MLSNGVIPEIAFREIELLFGGNFFKSFIALKWSELWKKLLGEICRCLYLPLNGVIAKIALRDLDMLFKVTNLCFFISLKR